MRCNSVLVRLDQFRTKELESGTCDEIREHLDDCRSCADSLEEIDELAGAGPALKERCPSSCHEEIRRSLSDRYDIVESDIGPLWVVFSSRGLVRVTLANRPEKVLLEEYCNRFGREAERGELPPEMREALRRTIGGGKSGRPEIDLSDLPQFEREVLEVLVKIPAGQVRSYAWVAREAGRPAAIRAVGNACARNPIPFVVPCHRVVPSSGGIGNYGFGPALKRALLAREGVIVDELDDLGERGFRYVASATTKIYCFPTCPDARRIRKAHRVSLRSEQEAARLGFRPCRRCRPLAATA
ncbi:MAG TPA: methylated-DNA--[protein]-cysteine S-methyltransferase [Thermoanaerobaculia bacterium]|nr:methylated-DNA--[protein]-cysteine S-methyltransferase [Thermoanaerobaculia bacterium]